MEPVDHLSILRRRWPVIVLTALVGALAAFVVTPANAGKAGTVEYEATHTLLLQNRTPTDGQARTNARNEGLPAMAALTTGADVATRVANKVEYTGPPQRLTTNVEAEADTTVGSIKIKVTSTNPDRAKLLADTFASELVGMLDEKAQSSRQASIDEAQQRMQLLQGSIRALDAKIGSAGLAQASVFTAERDALVRQYSVAYERFQSAASTPEQTSGLATLSEATPRKADAGLQPPRTRNGRMLFAGLVGLLVGVGLALVMERLDDRLRTKAAAESAFGLPVLAEVPPLPVSMRRRSEVATLTRPNSIIAEAYRALRTSLLFAHEPSASGDGYAEMEEAPLRVVMVSSPNPGEGKTTTAVNLAASLAETGRTVLVIDCDFRHPRANRYLGVDGEGAGLSDVLEGGPRAPRLADVVRKTSVPGVRMITSGTSTEHPAELFARGHDIVPEAIKLADVVVLDTPPVLAINDASELLPGCDAVVLVCRSGRTTADEAARTSELLHRLGAPVKGVALIGATEAPASKGYNYYYYLSAEQSRSPLRRLFSRHRGPTRPDPSRRDPGPSAQRPQKRKSPPPPPAPRQGKPAKGKKGPEPRPVAVETQQPPRPPAAAVARPAQPQPQPAQPQPQPAQPQPAQPQARPQPAQPQAQPAAPPQQPRPAQAPAAQPPRQGDQAFQPPRPNGQPVSPGAAPAQREPQSPREAAKRLGPPSAKARQKPVEGFEDLAAVAPEAPPLDDPDLVAPADTRVHVDDFFRPS